MSKIVCLSIAIVLLILSGSILMFCNTNNKYVCYSGLINVNEKTKNIITICTGKNKAKIDVFFPNNGNNPTICRQNGSSKRDKENILLTMDSGQCENTKNFNSGVIQCKLVNSINLDCIEGEHKLNLTEKYSIESNRYSFK